MKKTGLAFGTIAGSATGDSIGEAINNGMKPAIKDSVNAQVGLLEATFDVLMAPANVHSEEQN